MISVILFGVIKDQTRNCMNEQEFNFSESNTLAVKYRYFNSGMRSLCIYVFYPIIYGVFNFIVTEKIMIVYITYICITVYSRRCAWFEVLKKEAK